MQIDAHARATFQRNNSLGYLITWTGMGTEHKTQYKLKRSISISPPLYIPSVVGGVSEETTGGSCTFLISFLTSVENA